MNDGFGEKGFEDAVEDWLIQSGGYVRGDPSEFDASLGLFPKPLLAFLEQSQPEEWARLQSIYGGEAQARVLKTVCQNLDQRGMLDVLRGGITDRGVKLRLAYFRPASGMNEATLRLYAANVLTVTRQVHQSPKIAGQSVDLVLALNGLPVATAELKTPAKGQTYKHAMAQYRQRDPGDPVFAFKTRALVHFAVDTDLVYMTTRLRGKATHFLPFNRGNNGGAGNPPSYSYKTSYLWEEVWERHSWLDILARFLHIEVSETKVNGKARKNETMIFPRFHQLDAVRKMIGDVLVTGAGKNYLVQHSAGSGKSNTIAWLAHRLSNLHDDADKAIFSSVIVVTDRRVLDKQLQDTIYQFDHRAGVVEGIPSDAGAKSPKLAQALNAGTRIIITTVQTFPFVVDLVSDLADRTFAVIADEAHSSQSGETAAEMKRVLAAKSEGEDAEPEDEEWDLEDAVLDVIGSRGPQPNLSFFAFTATPKKRTLEMFGTARGNDPKPKAFHVYSMRQAIDEGFILDVLKHYTTYKTYFRLSKAIEDDPKVDKDKAKRAIARFINLHPHHLAQKTEVIIEHFRGFTRKRVGSRAKAMVVTGSREHAIRYKLAFDNYLAEKGYDDTKAIVAFSGSKEVDGQPYTEKDMNGFGERQLPEKFASDEFQLLLVAEKYQTGFDQPLLHTMYVDKRLKGLQAVQTLSRLNRMCRGKEDTFVLDFVNEPEDIQEAFKPYFEATEIDEPTDPNQLYILKSKLDQFQFYWAQEVDDFARTFFKPKTQQKPADQGQLHKCVDPAVQRFADDPEDDRREEFRHLLDSFIRLYSFLSQMIDYSDVDLEKLYAFGRLLRTKLPKREQGDGLVLDEDVELAYYRNDKTFAGELSLDAGDSIPVKGAMEVGTGQVHEPDLIPLSEIIQSFNDKFGTDFSDDDKLLFEQVARSLATDEKLAKQARANSLDQFRYAFNERAINELIKSNERNTKTSSKIFSDKKLRGLWLDLMRMDFFRRANMVPAHAITPDDMVEAGESSQVEFKSSARWDLKQNQANPILEYVIIKTVAGYMNGKGGTLLIGVDDDGKVLGLKSDLKLMKGKDRDGYELWLTDIIGRSLGKPNIAHARISFPEASGEMICRVDVNPAPEPVFATPLKGEKKAEFWVRMNNSTRQMDMKEMHVYQKARFGSA